MVATPWGDSEGLRAETPASGNGTALAEAVPDERERLFAAMVARVSERGYAPVEVSDLLELSGVSKSAFYELFPDKRECFVATLDATIEAAIGQAGEMGRRRGEDWETYAHRGLLFFAELVATQPAAARAGLVDAVTAGTEAQRRLEEAIEALESAVGRLLERSPHQAGLPPEMLTALVGAARELAVARLRRSRERELPRAIEEAADLLLSYRPPPRPLQLAVRPPDQGPERLDAPDHADRAIRAFAVLVAERGYRETRIEDVLRRSAIGRSAFEADFADKQDLMAAAIDSACAQTVAAAAPAFSRVAEWPRAVRALYGAMLNFLASRPALANLLLVGVHAAGDEAVERRAAGMTPLQNLLENNTVDWMHMPPVVYEALSGAVGWLLYRTTLRSGAGALPELAPLCTYLTLSPFLGAEEACEVANGSGGRREGERPLGAWNAYATPGAIPYREPIQRTVWKAMATLRVRDATPAELAEANDEEVEVVADYLRQLASIEAVEVIGERDGEPLYHEPGRGEIPRFHKVNIFSSRQAALLTEPERRELSRGLCEVIEGDVERAIRTGTFDKRLDRYLVRVPLRVDERGWRELTDLHQQTMHAAFEIQARSTVRLRESGEPGIAARSVQLMFEAAEEEG